MRTVNPSPPSRPMAAVMRRQSREDHETARAGYEGLLPAVAPGQVASVREASVSRWAEEAGPNRPQT